MACYMGIDVGTGALKAVIVDETGTVCWSHQRSYETVVAMPGWAEQNPQLWLKAYDEALDAASHYSRVDEVRSIGFTGQMHTTVVMDKDHRPLRPAILWSDTRASGYGAKLREAYGDRFLRERTGNLPLSNFSLLRLLWVRDNEPEIYRQIEAVAVAKDWLRDVVTRTRYTDVTDASGTLLFDVSHRRWNESWMHEMNIPEFWWGTSVESATTVGGLCRAPQVMRGIPVAAGAGDQEASSFGTHLSLEGDQLGVSLGTSGVIFWPRADALLAEHPSIHTFCHAHPNYWHWMGVTQSAAMSLQWYCDTFFPGVPVDMILQDAESSPIGARGVLFFPYLNGERAPLNNPKAQGTFMGIRGDVSRSDILRAVLEGVIYSLFHTWGMMSTPDADGVHEIVVTGGGAKSPLWTQMMADVFQIPVRVVKDPGAAVGAAFLGAHAIGEGGFLRPASHRDASIIVEPHIESPYPELARTYIKWSEELDGLWRRHSRPN